MIELQFYNTLGKIVETFQPSSSDKVVRMYTCGPTVYNQVHIGNLRSFIFADVMYRTFKLNGLQVQYVMNITDVDDKTIRGTIEQYGPSASILDLKKYTEQFLNTFLTDLNKVNIDTKNIQFIKVSDSIPKIQELVSKLITLGFAYEADDGIYFSIEKYQDQFHDYGILVGPQFLEGKKTGARVAVDEYDKDNLSDFALWKYYSENDAQIFWEFPGYKAGRPGWHIECSAINSLAFQNQPTDIHTGGVDLVFPHHTNEIAQSQPIAPFVKHWMHIEHLLVENEKMAKSKQNFFTLTDLEQKGFSGFDLRYLFLQASYRTQANFSWDELKASQTARIKLNTLNHSTTNQQSQDLDVQFLDALNNDLNTAKALSVIWEHKDNPGPYLNALGLDSEILEVTETEVRPEQLPDEIQTLLKQREMARQNNDYQLSDQLREQIQSAGYTITDSKLGQTIFKKS